MAKNVLIFSDGTGQGAGGKKEERSNVRKLYDATCEVDTARQVAYYDLGLGAPDDESRYPLRYVQDLISQATGLGISRNIKDCYAALIERYEPGDNIFLFGFSRGAYTVRSLGGVLKLCGVPQKHPSGASPRTDKTVREALVEEAVETVYKHYGSDEMTKAERLALGDEYSRTYGSHPAPPYLIGVWDTVRALGIPGSSGMMFWRHKFHDASLNALVKYGRQVLAIDENREVFNPELWDETEQDRASGRIKQIWFPGVHSDIGGGYPECELSDLALEWMIKEATSIPAPLLVDHAQLDLKPSFCGMQHDERAGSGWFWAEGMRKIEEGASLYEDHVGRRFREKEISVLGRKCPYRPLALKELKSYRNLYEAIAGR